MSSFVSVKKYPLKSPQNNLESRKRDRDFLKYMYSSCMARINTLKECMRRNMSIQLHFFRFLSVAGYTNEKQTAYSFKPNDPVWLSAYYSPRFCKLLIIKDIQSPHKSRFHGQCTYLKTLLMSWRYWLKNEWLEDSTPVALKTENGKNLGLFHHFKKPKSVFSCHTSKIVLQQE